MFSLTFCLLCAGCSWRLERRGWKAEHPEQIWATRFLLFTTCTACAPYGKESCHTAFGRPEHVAIALHTAASIHFQLKAESIRIKGSLSNRFKSVISLFRSLQVTIAELSCDTRRKGLTRQPNSVQRPVFQLCTWHSSERFETTIPELLS